MDNVPLNTHHCLLIGLDGVDVRLLTGNHSIAHMQLAETINYDHRSRVTLGHSYRPKSGPGWCTTLTGCDNHNCETNEDVYIPDASNPNVIERLRRVGKSIQVFASHTVIPYVLGVDNDTLKNCHDARDGPLMFAGTNGEFKLWLSRGNDQRTTELALSTLDIKKGRPADLIFIHLDAIDHAFHNHTVSSSEIENAVMATKLRVESLLDVIENRSKTYCENWMVMFVTDHGRFMPDPAWKIWDFMKYFWIAGNGYCSEGERQTFITRRYFEHSTSAFMNYSQSSPETLRDVMSIILSYIRS